MLYTSTAPAPANIMEGIRRAVSLAIISVNALIEKGSTRAEALAAIRLESTLGVRSWAAVEEGVKA